MLTPALLSGREAKAIRTEEAGNAAQGAATAAAEPVSASAPNPALPQSLLLQQLAQLDPQQRQQFILQQQAIAAQQAALQQQAADRQ